MWKSKFNVSYSLIALDSNSSISIELVDILKLINFRELSSKTYNSKAQLLYMSSKWVRVHGPITAQCPKQASPKKPI
jgi:hypothetical protein